jgi:hypothetical protein
MAQPTLLPDPTCLHLQLLDASSAAITAVVTTTSEAAECPLCHRRSARIHSHYVRQVADLPWMGCAVHLELHVHRFSALIESVRGSFSPNVCRASHWTYERILRGKHQASEEEEAILFAAPVPHLHWQVPLADTELFQGVDCISAGTWIVKREEEEHTTWTTEGS